MTPATRRLAAILFTDIVGYTALMAESEEKGLRVRERHRAVVRPLVEQYRGEWIEETGDESLSSFPSALDAVNCALAIQATLRDDPELKLRIGIHLGDVVFEEGRIYGDGVNVASRIRPLAEPGGTCVSGEIHRLVRNQPNIEATPLGEHELKNVAHAVSVFGIRGTPAEAPARLMPARPIRRTVLAGAAIAAVLVGGYLLLESREPRSRPITATATPASPTALAVLPFEFQGSEEFAYLSEGLVNLLSIKLDGAGGLRRVDPHALLSFLSRHGSGALDPEQARAVAERFGAGLYILGGVLEVGGRLHLEASLYDSTRGFEAVARGAGEGEPAEISEVVDSLASQLLAARVRGPGWRLARLAALTTDSLPALKAYLEAESKFRSGFPNRAIEPLQRAVTADPSFALGWYRLSVSAGWMRRYRLAREAAGHAARHGGRLSDHDRGLLEAFLAFRRGTPHEAERRYESLVSRYPDDFEAWYMLGETLFHYGAALGRPVAESRHAFERALDLDPQSFEPYQHLARILALDGRYVELASLTERYLETDRERFPALLLRALRAFAVGDSLAKGELMAKLAEAEPSELSFAAETVALWAQNVPASLEMLRVLTEPGRTADYRAVGHRLAASLELAMGRWDAAREELSLLEELDPATAIEHRALFSALPFLAVSGEDLARLREELLHWDAAAVAPSGIGMTEVTPHEGLHSLLRLYLLGLLSARLGDPDETLRYASELDRSEAPPEVANAHRVLAQGLRAEAAWTRKQIAEAWSAISELAFFEADPTLNRVSPFYAQSSERYLRARLLAAQGLHETALRWYRTIAEVSVYDLPYLAPSHLRRAQIYEKLGRVDRAIEHYARFVQLWEDCDPELRPMVAQAEQRLEALKGPVPEP